MTLIYRPPRRSSEFKPVTIGPLTISSYYSSGSKVEYHIPYIEGCDEKEEARIIESLRKIGDILYKAEASESVYVPKKRYHYRVGAGALQFRWVHNPKTLPPQIGWYGSINIKMGPEKLIKLLKEHKIDELDIKEPIIDKDIRIVVSGCKWLVPEKIPLLSLEKDSTVLKVNISNKESIWWFCNNKFEPNYEAIRMWITSYGFADEDITKWCNFRLPRSSSKLSDGAVDEIMDFLKSKESDIKKRAKSKKLNKTGIRSISSGRPFFVVKNISIQVPSTLQGRALYEVVEKSELVKPDVNPLIIVKFGGYRNELYFGFDGDKFRKVRSHKVSQQNRGSYYRTYRWLYELEQEIDCEFTITKIQRHFKKAFNGTKGS